MLINTLQLYLKGRENNPIFLGIDRSENSKWFSKLIETKLVLDKKIKIY